MKIFVIKRIWKPIKHSINVKWYLTIYFRSIMDFTFNLNRSKDISSSNICKRNHLGFTHSEHSKCNPIQRIVRFRIPVWNLPGGSNCFRLCIKVQYCPWRNCKVSDSIYTSSMSRICSINCSRSTKIITIWIQKIFFW